MVSTAARRAVERQRAGTRQAILDAALTLMRERPLETFSHESVAERAAVSARTVYRHFPTRRDLTGGLWVRLRDETGTKWPGREDEIGPSLRRTFQQFEEFSALTRSAIAAAAATEYPVHGSAEGRAAFQRSLSDIFERLPEADGRALIAACVAITARRSGRCCATAASSRRAAPKTPPSWPSRPSSRRPAGRRLGPTPGGRHDDRINPRRSARSPSGPIRDAAQRRSMSSASRRSSRCPRATATGRWRCFT